MAAVFRAQSASSFALVLGCVTSCGSSSRLDAQPVVDSGAPNGQRAECSDVARPNEVPMGLVYAYSEPDVGDPRTGQPGTYRAFAGFAQKANSNCRDKFVDGPCATTLCYEGPPDGVAAQSGVITIATRQATLLFVPPYPMQLSGPLPLWAAREMLQIASEGSDVPAFTGAVRGPTQLSNAQGPGLSKYPAVDRIPAQSDYELTWQPGTDLVQIQFVTSAGWVGSTTTCTFCGEAGKGIVPAAALGRLQVAYPVTVSATATNLVDVQAGDFRIRLQASILSARGSMAFDL